MAGRKPVHTKVDPVQVENYAQLGATNTDIALMVGVSATTLTRHFGGNLAKGRAKRRTTLRGWQWEAAKKGNTSMLIWLGKNELGQTDKQEVSGPGGGAIQNEHTISLSRQLADDPEAQEAAKVLAQRQASLAAKSNDETSD